MGKQVLSMDSFSMTWKERVVDSVFFACAVISGLAAAAYSKVYCLSKRRDLGCSGCKCGWICHDAEAEDL